MIGRARGHGAGTIVSALATGRGAAFGLDLRVTATYEAVAAELSVTTAEGVDTRLVEACVSQLVADRPHGARVLVESAIPPSRGLKSSSAVANTVLRAGARALGLSVSEDAVLRRSVDAAVAAGVTITGAFDDAVACLRGGVAVTDNRRREVLRVDRLPDGLVAVVHIPPRATPKSVVKDVDFSPAIPAAEEALRLALRGEYAAAMNRNHAAYGDLLDADPEVAARAKEAGAVAASVSGAGPATIALVRHDLARDVARALHDGEAEVRLASLAPPLEVIA